METIIANVAAQIVIAEEAAIKRDLNKVVAALIEAVRNLNEGAALLSSGSTPTLEKKAPARKAPKAKAPTKTQSASKRTAPVIKPK